MDKHHGKANKATPDRFGGATRPSHLPLALNDRFGETVPIA
jgi:hypothetical protein